MALSLKAKKTQMADKVESRRVSSRTELKCIFLKTISCSLKWDENVAYSKDAERLKRHRVFLSRSLLITALLLCEKIYMAWNILVRWIKNVPGVRSIRGTNVLNRDLKILMINSFDMLTFPATTETLCLKNSLVLSHGNSHRVFQLFHIFHRVQRRCVCR